MTTHDEKKDTWRVWDQLPSYGEALYQRAIGTAPEMESSKAVAHHLSGILVSGSRLLDVGCGAGHYLRSLRRAFHFSFSYIGVDATENYLALGRQAFDNDAEARFELGDIYDLPFEAASFDIVLCANLLLHLPSIIKPLQELWRVTRRFMLVRTLIGDTSFRIKQVREWDQEKVGGGKDSRLLSKTIDPVFGDDGEPHHYHYFNIYSHEYIEWCVSTLPGIEKIEILQDKLYDPEALGSRNYPGSEVPPDVTEIVGKWQSNGYILEPWAFLKAFRSSGGSG